MLWGFLRLRSERTETALTPRTLVSRIVEMPETAEGVCPYCCEPTTIYPSRSGPIEHCNSCGEFIDRAEKGRS